ncbi:MAG: hypothetical protein EAZ53_10200 [Bacteroidetes bacterium]|nr:MAG: hypothetical protein EAZ53_10200 [Bacteroidota bacterium]
MFDSSFSFSKSGIKSSDSQYIRKIYLYKFNTPKRTYICEVELYDLEIYIIKFYDRKDKNNPYRFSKLTGDGIATRIIRTCLNVLSSIHKSSPSASFGFIGINSIHESLDNTKRYKLYSKISANLFGIGTFEHVYSDRYSVYFFANKCHSELEKYVNSCKHLFEKIYPTLELQ